MSDVIFGTYDIGDLRLCEHCDKVILFSTLPLDSLLINQGWPCPECHKMLTLKTLAFGKLKGKWQMVKWVGPDGKWTNIRPSEDFRLNNWLIRAE